MAMQVVQSEGDHTFYLNEEALAKVLLDPRVRNSKVMIVSVAGAYRKGKSFLLNFFLKYLHSREKNWMGNPSEPLLGFSWKGGSERTTSGIQLWGEPFFMMLPTGENVCILLMDTQGAFDSQSTVKECATVFALSTMISSVQVYNITTNIQEDDLQHLELFTEYGRLALEAYDDKPFQNLHFLVRDWQYPYQYPYGAEGGKQILEKRLQITEKQAQELQKLRKHLRDCFKDISCFLMPHPGLSVATSAQFNGKLEDIEEEFKLHVKTFTEHIFAPKNIVVKKINGNYITGKDLVEYFKAYVKIFQGNDLPEPKSMLEATAEANNLAAVATSKEIYMKEMEKVCGGDKPFMNVEALQKTHEKCFSEAINLFRTTRKMGGDEFCAIYEKKLEKELLEMYSAQKLNNQAKNITTAVQTPLFFIVLAVAVYTLSMFFALAGLDSFVRLCNLLMLLSIVCLFVWGYCRYTGQHRWAGDMMDEISKFCYQRLTGKAPQLTTAGLVSGAAANVLTKKHT